MSGENCGCSGSDGAKMAAGESGWWPPHDGALIVKGYPPLPHNQSKTLPVKDDKACIITLLLESPICEAAPGQLSCRSVTSKSRDLILVLQDYTISTYLMHVGFL